MLFVLLVILLIVDILLKNYSEYVMMVGLVSILVLQHMVLVQIKELSLKSMVWVKVLVLEFILHGLGHILMLLMMLVITIVFLCIIISHMKQQEVLILNHMLLNKILLVLLILILRLVKVLILKLEDKDEVVLILLVIGVLDQVLPHHNNFYM